MLLKHFSLVTAQFTPKTTISVRPRVRLQQDEPVQVHMQETNPKKLPTVTRIVNGIFLATMNNITHFFKLSN